MIEVGEFRCFSISLIKGRVWIFIFKEVIVSSSPNGPKTEGKECRPTDSIIIFGAMKEFPSISPYGMLEKVDRNGGVPFVTMNKIYPKRRSMAIFKEEMIDVLKRVVTVMEKGRSVDTSMSKSGFSREAIVVNEPEEKFEFVGNLDPSNPTQGKIDPG